MNVLIIGYGSIGSRHYEILNTLGCHTSVVSNRELDFKRSYKCLDDALDKEKPDYIVIANKTNEHYSTMLKLKKIGFNGPVLVEKPLFHNLMKLPEQGFENFFVAFNMRFNPLIQRMYQEIKGENIISAQAYVGQYLPQWREGRDYRSFYSAHKAQGGGVLRDLSHELDFINWLFGGWCYTSALGGNFSDLEIDSDDVFALLLETKRCPVATIQLNYIDKVTQRDFIVNTNKHTFKIDFIKKTFTKDNEVEAFQFERNFSYSMQHKAILENHMESLCTLEDGMDVQRLINAAENSAYSKKKCWVKNETNL
jgi:predicted dehydrogenase